MKVYTVRAIRDADSGRWLTDGEGEIPGLVCESTSLDKLIEVIAAAAPDLVHDNLGMPKDEPFTIRLVTEPWLLK
jgi:hypothetical protein